MQLNIICCSSGFATLPTLYLFMGMEICVQQLPFCRWNHLRGYIHTPLQLPNCVSPFVSNNCVLLVSVITQRISASSFIVFNLHKYSAKLATFLGLKGQISIIHPHFVCAPEKTSCRWMFQREKTTRVKLSNPCYFPSPPFCFTLCAFFGESECHSQVSPSRPLLIGCNNT